MATVSMRGVRKSFGPVPILAGIDLDVADQEFIALVGPSGCGKSTLLRLIAGLERLSAGEIRIGDERVNDLSPMHRDVAMVFQSYALYPHMTVSGNISFGLRLRRLAKERIQAAVAGAASVLNLDRLLDRRPGQLSGGQRQRVAMGRAMVRSPKLFLFDEPLSNLDAKLRVQMRAEIKALHRRLGSTSIYVTHDQVEAMTMADRIVVMNGGRIKQQGTPEELYDRPDSLFVAGFIGSPAMNLLSGIFRDGQVVLEGGLALPFPPSSARNGQDVTLGVRPEDVRPAIGGHGEGGHGEGGLAAELVDVEPTGADTLVLCRLAGRPVVASVRDRFRAAPGSPLRLSIATARLHGFDTRTGRNVGT